MFGTLQQHLFCGGLMKTPHIFLAFGRLTRFSLEYESVSKTFVRRLLKTFLIDFFLTHSLLSLIFLKLFSLLINQFFLFWPLDKYERINASYLESSTASFLWGLIKKQHIQTMCKILQWVFNNHFDK